MSPKVLDLNETVEGMLKMLRRLIGEDIDLIWLPGKRVGNVLIDPSQVDQIMANLCINSRDAISGAGKITIETDVITFDEPFCDSHAGFVPGDYVKLAVSDNGCGMNSKTLNQLFEPFFTTKAQGKGTGLGLAMVYGAVKQNNGHINVYSEPGHGTTFKVFLPSYRSATAFHTEQQQTQIPAANGEIILLVEDEPAILKMARQMLESVGYVVIAVATPGEAISKAQELHGGIDLLITDVVMPEINGRELVRNITSIYPDIKYLYISGYTADTIAHKGVLDEGINFIQKPFTRNALAAKIREVLEHK